MTTKRATMPGGSYRHSLELIDLIEALILTQI